MNYPQIVHREKWLLGLILGHTISFLILDNNLHTSNFRKNFWCRYRWSFGDSLRETVPYFSSIYKGDKVNIDLLENFFIY